MLLHWYGHACFLLKTDHTSIMLDPFNEKVGYPLPEDRPDFVTVSHDHYDHSSVGLVHGKPVVKRSPEEESLGDVRVYGVTTDHDPEGGTKRGKNTVFVFEHEGIRLVHLGDLGHTLTEEQIAAIGPVDVLLIPVGGVYTIDARGACKVTGQLNPRLVIPMHFRTKDLSFVLGEVQEFCEHWQNVTYSELATINITPEALPQTKQVLVMEYSNKA